MLAPEFLPVWGGVGTYIVELVRHLPRSIEIHVVTPFREKLGPSEVKTSDYDFGEYFGDNVHVHLISSASDTFFYNAAFQYTCLRRVPRLVKELGIHLLHSHTAHMPDLLLQFRRLKTPRASTGAFTQVPINYRPRIGSKKLGTWKHGFAILSPAFGLAKRYNPILLYSGLASLSVVPAALLPGWVAVEQLTRHIWHSGWALFGVMLSLAAVQSFTLASVSLLAKHVEERLARKKAVARKQSSAAEE